MVGIRITSAQTEADLKTNVKIKNKKMSKELQARTEADSSANAAQLPSANLAQNPLLTAVDCQECDGTGKVCYSCCGDDIKGNDIDLCPTCYEHCGMDEEDCESCGGTGLSNGS